MAKYVCPKCGYKFWVEIDDTSGYCSACGYFHQYIRRYQHCTPKELKAMGEQISIRSIVCAINEKDTTKKGLHAYCVLTNHSIQLEIFEKFEYGIFRNKKWTFRSNPRLFIPYESITGIERGVYQGQPATFYVYHTQEHGALPLYFSVDAGVADGCACIDDEVKALVEQFMMA